MPASPSTARALNEQSVLRLLDSEGALTAGQLKTLTGLSRPTISDLLERLRGSGCVRVVGETGGQRRGPNAKLYGIATDLAYLAALDVRADGLRVVVADLSCAALSETTLPLSDGIERAIPRLVALLGSAGPSRARLYSVSVAVPGPADPGAVDPRDLTSPPAWLHELVTALQEELTVNVVVTNATQLAAVAEHRLGAARDQDDFVLLWLGQWVSLAVVFRGTVRCGATGGARQIGFLPVPGRHGLHGATDRGVGFHALVGATAVGDLAAEHGFGGAAEAAVRAAVAAEHRGGAGAAFLDALAARVAVGAAAVAAVYDPGCLVLGGEIGHAGGTALASRAEASLATLSPVRTRILPTALGREAIVRGGLRTACDAAQAELWAPAG